MSFCCQHDDRREAVRALAGRVGLDYVEVREDEPSLYVYFLGDLPPELAGGEDTERHLRVDGGERIRNIRVVDVDPVVDAAGLQDPYVVVHLDTAGDFSTYTLRLVDVEGADPRYDHVDFSFHLDCPRDIDCVAACACEPATPPEPPIDYLAKDYASFRGLILDRLAALMPGWTERHVPDIGIALVEVLAYTGDYLSYYQDAVATEAYLDTARERISVRRHVRLVDYHLHEGCNARAWVCLEVSEDLPLPGDSTFVTGVTGVLEAAPTVLSWDALRGIPSTSYEIFEPIRVPGAAQITLRKAHNVISFYTWGDTECCLERGSTAAILLDSWTVDPTDAAQPAEGAGPAEPGRGLKLAAGDVLIFEEVVGPKTGLPADADPLRRHAVRLTRVTPGEDPVRTTGDGRPTPYVEIEWGPEDALPFTFCISAIGPSPDCRDLEDISVARGNVVLTDHGSTREPEPLPGPVPTLSTEAACLCADHPGDIQTVPGPYTPHLAAVPLTFRQAPAADRPTRLVPAAGLLRQDVRATVPQVVLVSEPALPWLPRQDLLASEAGDAHFVVEIDNDGVAHLRFGDGELGTAPAAGMSFSATYRTGKGVAGNVGAEAISHLVLKITSLDGITISVRNPLPAAGGTEAESIADAKLLAPHAFRTRIERAITAQDYAEIAGRDSAVQRAAAQLVWTGSWYEADVAGDPLGTEVAGEELLEHIQRRLFRFRRIGHDLRAVPARYVALDLRLDVCAKPHFQRGHVRAALLDAFSNRILAGGVKGFFHPDNLSFGQSIFTSRIVAAGQAIAGVGCVTVTRLQRRFEAPNNEIEQGFLPLRGWEIARLDNDGNHPERGRLEIVVSEGL